MKLNRAYKKGEGFRDASLIVIACEGAKTEPAYFTFFEQIHPIRCKVEILKSVRENLPHKSAPKWLLENVKNYKEDTQLGEGDFLFIVSDVDRWEMKALYEVNTFCEQLKNHFFILSNPCFEVWLYFHLGNPKTVTATNCREWKNILHKKTEVGFQIEKFSKHILLATENAKKSDSNPSFFFPDEKQTKIYKIIETIIAKSGRERFVSFCD